MKAIKFIVRLILCALLILLCQLPAYASGGSADDNFSHDDIILLAKVINGESGADWCSDEMRYGVGSVVVNRVEHEDFPDTLEEVVFQKGQYGCTDTRAFKQYPPSNCIQIATDIIENGSIYPSNVVFQSNQPLGSGTYEHIQNMYFGMR